MPEPDLASVVPFGMEPFNLAVALLMVVPSDLQRPESWDAKVQGPAYWDADDDDSNEITPRDKFLTPYGAEWRNRALGHLCRRLDKELRERPRLDSEQAALAMIKGVGQELKAAGLALDVAARHLKDQGKGLQASQAKQAAGRALQAAEGLVGS